MVYENKVGWFCENNLVRIIWLGFVRIMSGVFSENKVGWFDSVTWGSFAVRGSESAFAPPPQERQSTQAASEGTTCCEDATASSPCDSRVSFSCLCFDDATGYLWTSAGSSTN